MPGFAEKEIFKQSAKNIPLQKEEKEESKEKPRPKFIYRDPDSPKYRDVFKKRG